VAVIAGSASTSITISSVVAAGHGERLSSIERFVDQPPKGEIDGFPLGLQTIPAHDLAHETVAELHIVRISNRADLAKRRTMAMVGVIDCFSNSDQPRSARVFQRSRPNVPAPGTVGRLVFTPQVDDNQQLRSAPVPPASPQRSARPSSPTSPAPHRR